MKRLVLGAVAIVVTACSSTSAQQTHQPTPSDVVATVGSATVTLAQVDEKAMQAPATGFGQVKLSQAIYEARRAAIEEIVASKLLDDEAKTQGIDRAALVEKEITSKTPDVTDGDIQTWYTANQARVQGAPLEQVRQPIRQYLTQQRMEAARESYLVTLR